MAWLEQHPTSGRFKICFRFGGRQLKKTVKVTERQQAEAILLRLEENVGLIERGRLQVPAGADIATFLLTDGHLTQPVQAEALPKPFTLGELRDLYVAAHSQGAMEANSLQTATMHLGHFVTSLGPTYSIKELTLDDLQQHVNRRARKTYRGRPLSPVTLRKEVASLRACWNWGVQAGKVSGPFPNRGLKYPKANEKPPFQTWQEIERQIARGGLTEAEQEDLWNCLFLTLTQVAAVLAHVKEHAQLPFVFPLFAFAAHTGARRSEMLRVRVDDLDMEGQTVLLREKKRSREKRTTRRVPLSPFLRDLLHDWLKVHPGGPFLFCQAAAVAHSKTKRSAPTPVTRDEAHDHFRRTLAGSPWAVLRGWHVFRHSFCSNCAAAGIDQRLIDAWVGHQTEEMRKRYRHLIPGQERQAIQAVFGPATPVPPSPVTGETVLAAAAS
jgi:integrase